MSCCYIVMGVSGSGKSLIGSQLASAWSCPFYDADDFHPEENLAKLRAGTPLNDADRYPWLDRLIREVIVPSAHQTCVLACSALKKSYRDRLRTGGKVRFIYLCGDYQTIYARMRERKHFMRESMLQSQFDTLEPPGAEENAITVSIMHPPEMIVKQITDERGRCGL